MKDKIAQWIAWKLPKRIVYWAYLRVTAHATTGEHGHEFVEEITIMDALKRFDEET